MQSVLDIIKSSCVTRIVAGQRSIEDVRLKYQNDQARPAGTFPNP